MGHMGKKTQYGTHVGPEWDKCPDPAHMGPIYTCLLGLLVRIFSPVTFVAHHK